MPLQQQLYVLLDTFLIFPYRLFEHPLAGFFAGTAVLCIWTVLLGELTVPLLLRFNRRHLQRQKSEMTRMHNLSIKAILAKDKPSYTACNKIANEAFGRYFFAMFGVSAASLWPAPFALGWLATRFQQIELELLFTLPLIGQTAGFATVFVPMYILTRILSAKLKRRWGWGVDIASVIQTKEKMVHWGDIEKHGRFPEEAASSPPAAAIRSA